MLTSKLVMIYKMTKCESFLNPPEAAIMHMSVACLELHENQVQLSSPENLLLLLLTSANAPRLSFHLPYQCLRSVDCISDLQRVVQADMQMRQ